ncbi:5-formyltetrahydrofolate cyclo-ligase [Corynebacterium pseudotuberculosis]|nr:5-formyltetrahydrofolate cyclo-ligase [Corynebacterium pseudotuberculosis]
MYSMPAGQFDADKAQDLASQKQQKRRELSLARQQLHPSQRESFNNAIKEHLAVLVKNLGATKLAAYCADQQEPGGEELVTALFNLGITLWLPVSRPHGILEWGQYTHPDSLRPGALGILEPQGPYKHSHDILPTLDLIVVPALGATPEGIRIGKGAGYYDRALEDSRTPTVALLFDSEIDPAIPHESHDARTDFIITPSGTSTRQ